MRHLIFTSFAIVAVGVTSISSLMGSTQTNHINTTLVSFQEEAPPVPEPDVAIQETQESISDAPAIEAPVPAPEPESVLQDQVIIEQGYLPAEIVMPEAGYACGTCCSQPCCCPPCPVSTTFMITDPCKCCSYEICVTVPPCCVGIQPTVDWRGGIFGRRVAELCWPCCDKQVKVVVTKHGKVRVRG